VQTRTRARPLPAEARRAAILTTAIPLVRTQGRAVTTRAIADAAGVSEGTVFHAFGDKDALIEAVVEHEFRLERTESSLREIDPTAPLAERIRAVVAVMQRRLTSVFDLMTALGMHRPPDHDHRDDGRPPGHRTTMTLIADLLRPDSSALRFTPERTAELVRLLTFAGSHPAITDGSPLSAEQITDVLLHGVTTRNCPTAPRRDTGEATC
jgi:AcrR family transcriptional regulator